MPQMNYNRVHFPSTLKFFIGPFSTTSHRPRVGSPRALMAKRFSKSSGTSFPIVLLNTLAFDSPRPTPMEFTVSIQNPSSCPGIPLTPLCLQSLLPTP